MGQFWGIGYDCEKKFGIFWNELRHFGMDWDILGGFVTVCVLRLNMFAWDSSGGVGTVWCGLGKFWGGFGLLRRVWDSLGWIGTFWEGL